MKLATFCADGATALGLVNEEGVVDLTRRITDLPGDMSALIEQWPTFAERVAALCDAPADHPLAAVQLLAPIARPGKVLGIGLNYGEHLTEAAGVGFKSTGKQMWFFKPATALAGPYADVERPLVSGALDYEAELVFIVGRRCRHLSVDEAAQAIFGYCAGNDLSVRDWQTHTSQVTLGKSFDTHAPFGPWIVTADEVGDPQGLELRCLVNGELRQQSNTRQMLYSCAEQLALLSQVMTMEPGDVIFTGTPGGVGALMQPPAWLKAGDRVRVEIDGIGVIENLVVNEVGVTAAH